MTLRGRGVARDIRVIFTGNADDLIKAAAESDLALESVGNAADGAGKNWLSFSNVLKFGLPALLGAGTAALALTGNLGALAPILPVLAVGVGALLAPFLSLAAVMVALVGPLGLIAGLLGALGLGFVFAAKQAFGKGGGLAGALANLKSEFSDLAETLAGRFRPIFMWLINSASDALKYLDRIAKLPLAQAFHSLATTGVRAVTKFLEQVGHLVAKPLYLAVQLAFGKPGQGVSNQLGSLWDQVIRFFRRPQFGGPSIVSIISGWVGQHDFTSVGMRWGTELASAVFSAIGVAFQHLVAGRGGRMIFGGALAGGAIGATVGGPIGAALGAGIGAAAGGVLNHYWPRIVSTAKSVWSTVKTFAVAEFHAITTALEHFLGPTTWNNIGTIAKNVWSIIKTIAISTFRAIIAIGKTVWQVFDTLVIKSGLWKVTLGLVKVAIQVVAAVLAPISGITKTIIGWAIRLARTFDGAVLSAVQAVAGVIAGIIGGIKTAIGYASTLASVLGSAGGRGMPGHGTGTTPGRGGGGVNPVGHISVHFHGPAVGNNEITRVVQQAITQLSRSGNPVLFSGRTLR